MHAVARTVELGAAFQAHLRQVLAITGNAIPWSGDGWFLDLGVSTSDEHQFRLLYALRQPPQGAAADIKKISASTTAVLLLPRGLRDSTGITEVLLDLPLPDRTRVLRDIIAASNLTGQVPALLTAPPRARLVVDTRLGKIWFDGIEISDLKPGTQPFRFVEILARNAPAVVNKHELAAQLSAGRSTDGGQTVRSAKMTANKTIKAALEAKRLGFEAPFR